MLTANDLKKIGDVVDEKLTDVMDVVRAGFEANDEQFRRIDERFDLVDRKFDAVDRRFDRLEGKVSALTNVLQEKEIISESDKRRIHN